MPVKTSPRRDRFGELDTGVYAIIHRESGRRYVGSSAKPFRRRWDRHLSGLRRGKHHSARLQNAWNRYGESAFDFVIIERCAPAECISREQHFIDLYKSANRRVGFNILPIAGSPLGHKATQETRAKMRKIALARGKMTAETLRKMSEAMKERWRNPEYRLKNTAAMIAGINPEANKRTAEKNRGRKHTPESLAKMFSSGNAWSPASRTRAVETMRKNGALARMGNSRRGKPLSPETRKLISDLKTGVSLSVEHRASIVAGIAKRRRVNAWIDIHLGMRPNAIDWEVAA